MEIRTKYDFGDNLYFLHEGKVRFGAIILIALFEVRASDGDEGTTVVYYHMEIGGNKTAQKAQNEVFKRRADLIKSL